MTPELEQSIRTSIEGNLHGWCTVEKGLAIAEVILETQALVCVELGVWGARSILPQALALQYLEQTTHFKGMVYGIDPWKLSAALEGENPPGNDEWYKAIDLHDIHRHAMEQIWRNGLEHWTIIMRCWSHQAAHLFQSVDHLHIDGCHSEFSSCRDVEMWVPLVRSGGHVWFDDSDWATTQKAVKMLEEQLTPVKTVGTCRLFRKQ